MIESDTEQLIYIISKVSIYVIPIRTGNFLILGKNVPPYCIKPNHSPCHPAFSHEDYFHRNCAPVFNNYTEKDTCHVKMLCRKFVI